MSQIPSGLGRRVRAFFNYESTKLIREDEHGLLQVCEPFEVRGWEHARSLSLHQKARNRLGVGLD
jgi:hypothetical protein